jgi:histidine ammonia-lyase
VEVVSGGHFHGMPVAIEMFNLLQALAIMAQLSNMRCVRYVDEARNKGLGSDLKWPGPTDDKELRKRQALWSGMMIPEYVSAALTNWIGGACMPSHLFSLSTDAGQEDHVSMAANVALRVMDTLPRLAETLAIELAFAAQAAAIRKEMDYIPSKSFGPDGETKKERYQWSPEQRRLNQVGEAVLQKIYEVFPKVMSDRCMADQIQELAECVLQGNILRTAEGFVKLGSIK